MKLSLAQEMRDIDRAAIDGYGIPEIVLMENASREIAKAMDELVEGCAGKRITILAGTGNNGGDAFAAARHLHNSGARLRIFLIGALSKLTSSAEINRAISAKMGIEITVLETERDWDRLNVALRFSDGVMDGIIGTGFKGELRDNVRRAIEAVNAAGLPVLSIDVPSGIDADTGNIGSVAIRADVTMTLGLPKWGCLFAPASMHTGKLLVDGISIPQKLLEQEAIAQEFIDGSLAQSVMLPRMADVHKGSCGRILVIAGSRGMTGAACLAAGAALRAGAGIVTLACPESLNDIMEVKLTEVMTRPILEEKPGIMGISALKELLELSGQYDAALIGPGLGRDESTQELVRQFAAQAKCPLILDADAIFAFNGQGELLKNCGYRPVLTPHLGELAALLKTSVAELRKNLLLSTRKASRAFDAVLVAKSECTIVVYPDGRAYASSCGNSAMATAGCGDVLAGTIAGLYKQCLEGCAPIAGVYMHGTAGDRAAAKKGMGMLAGDILEMLTAVE